MFDGGDFMIESPFGWWFEFALLLLTGHEKWKLPKFFGKSSENLSFHYTTADYTAVLEKISKKSSDYFCFFPLCNTLEVILRSGSLFLQKNNSMSDRLNRVPLY